MEENKYYIFLMCVCRLSYPACNEHAPNCHLWSAQLYHISPHYLENAWFKRGLNIKGLFWFPLRNLSEILIILTRTERDVIKNVKLSSCTVPIFLSYFSWTRIYSTNFHKNTQISNLMTISLVAAELLHVYRRTDMKLIIAFRNFANALIIQYYYVINIFSVSPINSCR